MQEIRERVDDRHGSRRREPLDVAVIKRADNQPVHETRQHLGGVLNRFAATDLDIVFVEEKRIPTEFMNADFEGDARAGRRFGENQSPRLSLQRSGRSLPPARSLQLAGEGEQLRQLGPLEVGFFEEVLHRSGRM
jgi:hypothetical protein